MGTNVIAQNFSSKHLSRPLIDRHEICNKFGVGSSLQTYFLKFFLYP